MLSSAKLAWAAIRNITMARYNKLATKNLPEQYQAMKTTCMNFINSIVPRAAVARLRDYTPPFLPAPEALYNLAESVSPILPCEIFNILCTTLQNVKKASSRTTTMNLPLDASTPASGDERSQVTTHFAI